ncbi:MAG: hypothetical protein V4808_02860 [Pseudomonadota bacterium]
MSLLLPARRKLLLALCATAATIGLPSAAAAQTYICPGGPGPGEVQAGVQNGPGFNGVPVCAKDRFAAGEGEQSAEELAASYGPGPDPMARQLEAAIEIEKAALFGKIKEMQLQNDPRYKRYQNGGWEYFQDAPGARPGELCTAFFTRKNGYVAVTGPGKDSPNAYLTFWSADVPKPRDATQVQISLRQTGDAPAQTVTAFNTFNPAAGMGGITLAVPTVSALLDNMLEVHSFTVTLGGKAVAQVEWNGGHAARDKLKACIAKGRG